MPEEPFLFSVTFDIVHVLWMYRCLGDKFGDTPKRQPRGVWGHLISLSPQRQVWFPPSVLRSN